MWSAILKILGLVAKKVIGAVAKKGAEKVGEKAAGAAATTASKALGQKVAEGVGKMATNKSGDVAKEIFNTANLANAATEAPKLGGKSFGSVLSNIIGGKWGQLFKANKGSFTPADTSSQSRFGKITQGLLGNETFGSKVLLNTLGGLAQQGAISGSDVGQPDKNFGGMLMNSLAGAVPQAAQDRQKESFEVRQNILNMASDLDFSEDIVKKYQEPLSKEITALQDKAVNMMMNNRKKGVNYLTSQDLNTFQWDYLKLKKKLDKFNVGVQSLQDAQAKLRSKENQNGYWSESKFNKAVEYFMQEGQAPAEGFLYVNPQDPTEYFSGLTISPAQAWQPESEDKWYVKKSPLTDQQKTEIAFADFAANPRLRAWAEEQGINIDDPTSRYKLASQYAGTIEQPRTDYADLMKYKDLEEQRATRQQTAQENKANKIGYHVADDYLGKGSALVFDKKESKNVPKQYLEGIIGKPVASLSEYVPITFDHVDQNGNLVVTAGDAMYNIPLDKASGLLEGSFPGATDAAKSLIKNKKNPIYTPQQQNSNKKMTVEQLRNKWSY